MTPIYWVYVVLHASKSYKESIIKITLSHKYNTGKKTQAQIKQFGQSVIDNLFFKGLKCIERSIKLALNERNDW